MWLDGIPFHQRVLAATLDPHSPQRGSLPRGRFVVFHANRFLVISGCDLSLACPLLCPGGLRVDAFRRVATRAFDGRPRWGFCRFRPRMVMPALEPVPFLHSPAISPPGVFAVPDIAAPVRSVPDGLRPASASAEPDVALSSAVRAFFCEIL